MIELNKKTQQDFLNREWVQKLLDAGVDMSDAKYYILHTVEDEYDCGPDRDFIVYKEQVALYESLNPVPTYSTAELIYKLHEWIYPTIDGKEFSGPLVFLKDAPFYMFYYRLRTKDYDKNLPSEKQTDKWNESFMGEFETPIESLASLLLQCHTRDIGLKRKDTGDIRAKYERY